MEEFDAEDACSSQTSGTGTCGLSCVLVGRTPLRWVNGCCVGEGFMFLD